MKIGIPRAMYTYDYYAMYSNFFKSLGFEVVLSDETSKEIIEEGISLSVDENCLAYKIFLGHVANLVKRKQIENIDYIFIPRLSFFDKKETICVKFYALYDICVNIFNIDFLTLNIDHQLGDTEFKGYIQLGRKLDKGFADTLNAYLRAKKSQRLYELNKYKKQLNDINASQRNDVNILFVSHSYISHDKYMGVPIYNYLKSLNANIYYADINSANRKNTSYKNISNKVYWKSSKNLLNGIEEYKYKIDGILYLSVFPCGPDSLVNEMAIRKVNNIPSLNIILDEEDGVTGLYIRLESFIDIIESKKKHELKKASGE